MSGYKITKCIIADVPAEDLGTDLFPVAYSLQLLDGFRQSMFFNENIYNFLKDPFFISNKHIFAGALLNGKLIEKGTNIPLITIDLLLSKFKELIYPSSPKDKLDFLLKALIKNQKYEGEVIRLHKIASEPDFYYGNYFRSKEECNYYFNVLQQMGYIDATFNSKSNDGFDGVIDVSITYSGLNYFIEITNKGQLSDKCFIAMSFTPGNNSLKAIRNAIKEAIELTGYKPILVDEITIPSDKTINDTIISLLKECKFCVADFTEQKDGVYFESGHALGQGKPVIYACNEADFKNCHFDTNHFSHIVYKDSDDLKQKLIDRIRAWIS